MDTSNNNEEMNRNGREVSEARTVSFLREDRGWNLDRVRDYFHSEDGKRVGIIGGVIVLVVVALWILAAISLPGQALYGLKTNVFEPLGGAFRWTKESQAAYSVDLMKERFEEVKRLESNESVSEGAVAALSNRITENASAFSTVTAASEERTLDRRAVIDLTNEFASISSAIEEVAEESEQLLPLADTVSDVRRDALRRLDDEIEVYVSLVDDENLREFLTDELNEISRRVEDAGLSEEMTDRVGRSLANIAEAIAANDANDAVVGIFEAHRLIDTEEYLGVREN